MPPRTAAPRYVQFYPTLRCNAACDFCFNRGLAPVPDVAPADFERLLESLQAAGVPVIDLLGGEPTLHPRLEALVASIAARGMRGTLSTNGTGDLGLLERLEERYGRDTLRVGVSVNDGEVPAAIKDYIARCMPIVKSVCRRGWTLPPAARTHLARRGAEYCLILRDPLGEADLAGCVSYAEHAAALAQLRRAHPGAAGVACDGFVPAPENVEPLRGARCPAGTLKLSVLPDGSAYPCYLLFSRPEFRLGNLLTDDFGTIWAHPLLERFRSSPGNRCPRRDCGHHAACHGGCPAVSLLVAGDFEAPDPRCFPARPASPGGR